VVTKYLTCATTFCYCLGLQALQYCSDLHPTTKDIRKCT
jgi:hypothetical protein